MANGERPRVLILDDDWQRHERAEQIWKQAFVTHCWRFSQFTASLVGGQQYQLTTLDHDLGLSELALPPQVADRPDLVADYPNCGRRPMTGADAVMWAVMHSNPAQLGQICIHTGNPVGAQTMQCLIRRAGWIEPHVWPNMDPAWAALI